MLQPTSRGFFLSFSPLEGIYSRLMGGFRRVGVHLVGVVHQHYVLPR